MEGIFEQWKIYTVRVVGSMSKQVLTAAQIFSRLQIKYPEGQYVLMREVRDSTGFNAKRSADAVAFGIWPSRGFTLTGFEFKSSRSDWLSELKNPAKADPIMQYCDYWYLVTGSEDIAKLDEIPETWGLMVPYSKGLSAVKAAPKLSPIEITKKFVASMMRRATEGIVHKSQIQEELSKRYETGYDAAKTTFEYQLKSLHTKVKDLESELQKYRNAFQVSGWYPTADDIKGHVDKFKQFLDLCNQDAGLANYLAIIRERAQCVLNAVEPLTAKEPNG